MIREGGILKGQRVFGFVDHKDSLQQRDTALVAVPSAQQCDGVRLCPNRTSFTRRDRELDPAHMVLTSVHTKAHTGTLQTLMISVTKRASVSGRDNAVC